MAAANICHVANWMIWWGCRPLAYERQAVIDRLNASIRKGVANETYLKLLADLGSIPPTDEEMKPEYVKQFVSQESAKFRDLLGSDRGEK